MGGGDKEPLHCKECPSCVSFIPVHSSFGFLPDSTHLLALSERCTDPNTDDASSQPLEQHCRGWDSCPVPSLDRLFPGGISYPPPGFKSSLPGCPLWHKCWVLLKKHNWTNKGNIKSVAQTLRNPISGLIYIFISFCQTRLYLNSRLGAIGSCVCVCVGGTFAFPSSQRASSEVLNSCSPGAAR